MTRVTRGQVSIQKLRERLSRLEDPVAGTTLKIGASCREDQIEYFATRKLLEQKFAEHEHGTTVIASSRSRPRSFYFAARSVDARWGRQVQILPPQPI